MSRREVGAGVTAAVAAPVAPLLYFPGPWVLDAVSSAVPPAAARYFFSQAGFALSAVLLAPLVALVVGAVAWRRLASPARSRAEGLSRAP